MPRDGQPVNPATRAQVVARLVPGAVRNQIAREVEGVSAATVTKIAREEGFEFDRSMTELAVAAAQIDAKLTRARVAKMLLLRAEESLEKMDAPHSYWNWDKDGKFDLRIMPEPTPADQRQYMTIAAIGVQRHAELERIDATAPVEEAKSVVGNLFEAIRNVVDAAERDRLQDSEGQNAE